MASWPHVSSTVIYKSVEFLQRASMKISFIINGEKLIPESCSGLVDSLVSNYTQLFAVSSHLHLFNHKIVILCN